eukprot:gene3029-5938_t
MIERLIPIQGMVGAVDIDAEDDEAVDIDAENGGAVVADTRSCGLVDVDTEVYTVVGQLRPVRSTDGAAIDFDKDVGRCHREGVGVFAQQKPWVLVLGLGSSSARFLCDKILERGGSVRGMEATVGCSTQDRVCDPHKQPSFSSLLIALPLCAPVSTTESFQYENNVWLRATTLSRLGELLKIIDI